MAGICRILKILGKKKDVTDFIDPFLLDELKQQKNILNRIGNDRLEGIPSGEMQRLANGGPTAGGGADQELVNQRIAELMMEEPGLNEMRATNPDMFERQKLGIERLLSNLYEPRRARDIAETNFYRYGLYSVRGSRSDSRRLSDDGRRSAVDGGSTNGEQYFSQICLRIKLKRST